MGGTKPFPAALERPLSRPFPPFSQVPLPAEAVRKPSEFLQTIAQSEIFRDLVASKRSEGSKK
jgi:hypothetical protein